MFPRDRAKEDGTGESETQSWVQLARMAWVCRQHVNALLYPLRINLHMSDYFNSIIKNSALLQSDGG